MRYIIAFLVGFFMCSCSKAQVPVPVYAVTTVTSSLDTITSLVSIDAAGRVDTLNITSVRRYKPPVPVPPQPIPSGNTFIVPVIPISDMDFIAPMRGANAFYESTDGKAVNIPDKSKAPVYMDDDHRFNWKDLQNGSNSYTWSPLDNLIKQCANNGWKLSFGVVSCDNSQQAYPSFLGSNICPDFNSEAYLSAAETFLQALADHLSSTGLGIYVSHIDIRMIGNWGEWHYFGLTNPIYATSASCIRVIKAHIKAFPNIPLISVISAYQSNSNIPIDAAAYLLTASNSWGKVGIRSDHLGDNGNYNFDTKLNNRTYNGIVFQTEIMNRWQYATICGEPLNDVNKVSAGGSSPYWDLINEVKGLHISQFSNTDIAIGNSASEDNFRASSKTAGYRLEVDSGAYISVNGNCTLKLNYSNVGYAPIYENWVINFELRNGSTVAWSGKSTFNPKLFLPGQISITDNFTGITAGNYSLYLIVKDPTGIRKPLALANKNRGADGAYQLCSIVIK